MQNGKECIQVQASTVRTAPDAHHQTANSSAWPFPRPSALLHLAQILRPPHKSRHGQDDGWRLYLPPSVGKSSAESSLWAACFLLAAFFGAAFVLTSGAPDASSTVLYSLPFLANSSAYPINAQVSASERHGGEQEEYMGRTKAAQGLSGMSCMTSFTTSSRTRGTLCANR